MCYMPTFGLEATTNTNATYTLLIRENIVSRACACVRALWGGVGLLKVVEEITGRQRISEPQSQTFSLVERFWWREPFLI